MNKKNKNILIVGAVTLVLIIVLGVSYAFFSYNREGNMNSKLIVGDIYMKYKETTTLTLNDAMPSDTYLENNYFEFSIEGKNTYTKEDIWYDISLTHGEPSTNENRTIRLDDKFLHFRLVEVIDGNETELIQDKTYNSLDNKRIYVNTIPANTTEKVTHNYRLYMWIGNEVIIGNTANANYSVEDWNKVYASIKVNVTGDFNEKELNPSSQSTPESCFTTSDNGDGTVTITKYNVTKSSYLLNSNMTNEELQACVDYIGNTIGFPGDATAYCQGENTEFGTIQDGFGWYSDEDMTYFKEHNIAIISSSECDSESVVIPDTINGKTVTGIGPRSFTEIISVFDVPEYGGNLTSVEIPDSVTTIGEGAFEGNQLTSVVIPNSVTTIGHDAFENNQLTSAVIGNGVTTIGNWAFYNNKLTSVEIGNSVTTIGHDAFGRNQLTSIEIPDSVTTIEDYAFEFNQLINVEIGNSVTTIGEYAFSNNQLTSIEIPDSVTTIEKDAFSSNQLTSVEISDSVTTIEKNAFKYNQLTSVEIPNSVTTIGEYAFYYNQLTSVVIPNSVTTIGEWAFKYNRLTSVVIPNSVTTIEDYAFAYNQLTSVEIGNSVTTIGEYAFAYNQLTSVVIPNSVTTIGEWTFRFNQLTSVTIGNGITSIGKSAFEKLTNTYTENGITYYNNSNLSSITIDKSCNDIKNNLLSGSTNYYPWLSYNSPYTASGVTIYGSSNEVCDTF